MKETMIFIGAGFTAQLGLPTSFKQNEIFKSFFYGCDTAKYRELFNEINDACESDDELKERIATLKSLVSTFLSKDAFTVQNMYNLIDSYIDSGRYLECEGDVYTSEEIIAARKGMIVLLQLVFSHYNRSVINNPNSGLETYKNFFKSIGKAVLKEQKNKLTNIESLTDAEFIISPVSYTSLNWDPFFIWPMFIAHKELNDRNDNYICFEGHNLKLKIFNDFATFMAVKPIDMNNKQKRWFPYNETVATRINDSDHLHERCITLIKTYLPHGQTNWFECPFCGKLTMYLGDEWKLKSESLVIDNNDSYECINCNQKMKTDRSSMLLQTLYKKKTSYIQEIQTDMKLTIKKTKRLIFIGYSLPEDDIEYKSVFSSLKNEETEAYVVLFDKKSDSRWHKISEINSRISAENKQTINRFKEIFGEENTYFNLQGFPKAADLIIKIIDGTGDSSD